MKIKYLALLLTAAFLSACATTNKPSTVTVPAAAPRFAGTTWASDPGDSTMVFEPSGGWHEHWGKVHYHGTWQPISPYNAVVRFSDGKVRHFTMSGDGLRVFRKEEPCGWNRIQ